MTTYHGTLVAVELASGRYVPLPKLALGTVEGVGLVTAMSPDALMSGVFDAGADDGGAWRPLRAVYYRARKPGYRPRLWRHELRSTAMRRIAGRVVFLATGRAAAVCAMAGDFICGG